MGDGNSCRNSLTPWEVLVVFALSCNGCGICECVSLQQGYQCSSKQCGWEPPTGRRVTWQAIRPLATPPLPLDAAHHCSLVKHIMYPLYVQHSQPPTLSTSYIVSLPHKQPPTHTGLSTGRNIIDWEPHVSASPDSNALKKYVSRNG